VSITYGLHSSKDFEELDLDNRTKTILDALKDVVYLDDRQVKIVLADKIFLEHKMESYFVFSVKILNRKSEKLMNKHLGRLGRYDVSSTEPANL
jgi:hypothetical protein